MFDNSGITFLNADTIGFVKSLAIPHKANKDVITIKGNNSSFATIGIRSFLLKS